jgi:hypothetical protein
MRGRGLILVTLCLAALIVNLDTTIVNVALPSLVRQIGATTTGLQWVVDAYNLVFAALVLAAGSLSDRLGRKRMLLAGLAVFGAWRTLPQLNERRNDPSVDGARTPPNGSVMAPWRSRSMSSIESAPAAIPATRQATFRSGYTPVFAVIWT